MDQHTRNTPEAQQEHNTGPFSLTSVFQREHNGSALGASWEHKT